MSSRFLFLKFRDRQMHDVLMMLMLIELGIPALSFKPPRRPVGMQSFVMLLLLS